MSGLEPWRNLRPARERPERGPRIAAIRLIPNWFHAWWPALLWASIIFYASTDTFSSQNSGQVLAAIVRRLDSAITEGQLDALNFFMRKCAHFSEYFVFYLLVYRGVCGGHLAWRWSWGLGAWFIVAAYSILDELHQSLVVSRTASPWDSLLDSTGAFVAMLAAILVFRFFLRDSDGKHITSIPNMPRTGVDLPSPGE